MKYNVHAFAVVRVKIEGIEANSQKAAIEQVRNDFNFCKKFDKYKSPETEFAEEIAYWLVDEVGDSDYKNSRWHNGDLPIDLEPVISKEHVAPNE
jgi:hypothetical protein